MSVYQGPSELRLPLYPAAALPSLDAATGAAQQSIVTRPALVARLVGGLRRVRRSLTQPDACDMTPEHAAKYHDAYASIGANCNVADSASRHSALEACIPLLYSIRVPSARAQYLRRAACFAPAYVECPEQFMRQMLPHIESYGRGLSSREILQAAGL